ncbi:transglycosylase domain-containing protein [Janthinobacterium sp. 17J80-10]|uniref:transglycosylase domain-containing protein n=1 Tax=Janthinobacterium sp. 17J80-10 TaxID=2497863 RepID=UPI001005938D|nr:transglycosylase domain-containing protein [Janthinobacterium sp. 17J80-10]QAU34677.1 hypothetical protein EKL02_11045 [Janthinobacterium sp. 17J80-10]
MIRLRKWILGVLVVITVTPIIALLTWYVAFFLPHLNELKAQAKYGQEIVRPVKEALYPLAIAAEGEKGIRIGAIRDAYWSVLSRNNVPAVRRHINEWLWMLVSYIHFDEREIFGIWANCALLGCDKGLPEAARKYYGKAITEMSQRELAGLVALIKSPTAFAPGSKRSEKRIEVILEEIKPHNSSLNRDPQQQVAASRRLLWAC